MAAALGFAACTKPNPLDCADGNCTDPAHPFCDEDGSLLGQPETCIAVQCSPGDFQSCRGNQVVRCNATGNDYDIAQCDHGCDMASGGCVSCLSNAECQNPSPTCDGSTHTCRTCAADADCDSEVCDASGACVDPSTIIYVSADGSAAGDCGAQSSPCSFSRAFTIVDSSRQTVKLRAGEYTSEASLPLVLPAGQTDYIDAIGATIHTTLADAVFIISGPGTLHIKGATFSRVVGGNSHSSNVGIRCGDIQADVATHLAAEQLTFLGGGGNQISVDNCEATVSQSRFQGGGAPFVLFLVNQHSVLSLDRCWLESDPAHPSNPIYTSDVRDTLGARVHVSNSVFVNTADMFVPQGVVDIDHSTFVNQVYLVDCTDDTAGDDHGKRVYSNDVFVSTTGTSGSVAKGNCEFHYSLMYPQTNTITGGDHILFNVDPKLADIPHGDFHLSPVSPAIDAADPTSADLTDYDGNKRPEGPRSDLGAFELKP